MADPGFAQTDAEAAQRFARYGSRDPFPEIEPALLNSADVSDYVAATGMIYPFYYGKDTLKSATYEVAALGPYCYWDEHKVRNAGTLREGQVLTLPANTIVFVTLEPKFRVPDYLALRFNLRIRHVYQGLLLGTGPLVDPGFVGQLSVPLHNLTLNEYEIIGGRALIWLEVTKLSRPPDLEVEKPGAGPARSASFFRFDPKKRNLSLDAYLRKAFKGKPIASSIPTAVEEAGHHAEEAAEQAAQAKGQAVIAREQADKATKEATNLRTTGFIGAIIGLAAIFIGLGAIVLTTYTLIHDVDSRLAGETNTVVQLEAQERANAATISALQQQLCAAQGATASRGACSPTASPTPTTSASPTVP